MYLILFFTFPFVTSTAQSKKLLIIGVGPAKGAKLDGGGGDADDVDEPPPYNLDLLTFAYEQAVGAATEILRKLSGGSSAAAAVPASNASTTFWTINDKCGDEYDWQTNAYDKLAKVEKHDYVLHLGPVCEYHWQYDVAKEIVNYAADVKSIKELSSSTFLYATPTMTVVPAPNEQWVIGDKASLMKNFVSLNSNEEFLGTMLQSFADNFVTKYTTLISATIEPMSSKAKVCRRIFRVMHTLQPYFAFFWYFGNMPEMQWLEIWSNVLQRSRYIMFCGDEKPFASFLKAGENLWEPYRLSDFGIFYMTFGMKYKSTADESTYLSNIFSNLTAIILSNIKVINIRSTFQCDKFDTSTNLINKQFCEKLNKRISNLIQNQSKSFSESIRFLNEVRFYTVPIFQLFVTMLANMNQFWTAASVGDRVNLLKYLKIGERIDVYDLERSKNTMIKRSLVCTYDLPMIDKDHPSFACPLQYGSKEVPIKEPGECGFEPCVYESFFDWMALLWATVITLILCTIISLFVFIYFRSKPGDQELPAPIVTGPVLISFSKLTPAADDGDADADDMPLKLTEGGVTLALYQSEPVIVESFPVSNTIAQKAVDDAVATLVRYSLKNVCNILGYVFQPKPPVYALVTEFGDHGTLLDILCSESLDLTLKLPLLADLCCGLEHIHKSPLKFHGSLTSYHCIIDMHFVLKIQLTGFAGLKKLAPTEATIDQMGSSDSDKLWSAPEVLKQEKKIDMQLCDIYSFGIIAHEILNQRGTFYISNNEIMSYYRVADGPYPSMFNKPEMAHFIVNALKDKSRDTIRPSFVSDPNEEPVMLILKEMVVNCWQPVPSQRAKLSSARSVIQRAMKDMKITDVLLAMNQRLEYFTNHLNAAVEVRAKQAEMGHQRIMNVLDALFPGGVAEKLLAGERPPPVEYKQCCVYLNDIVGYTKICNQNSIETVVEFLDTLFLTYDSIIENYDIHPITRIGDAYLLVSGVPYEKDGKFHAKEIGQAALQIVTAVQQLNFSYIKGCKNLQIRTGIASGVAVAGVLGIEAPSFNIIGPAVEMASTLEGASAPFKILVNKEARDLMYGDFMFDSTPKEVPFYDETIIAYWLTGFKSTSAVASRSISKSSSKSKSATGRKSPRNRLDGKVTFKDAPATSTSIFL